MAQSLVIVDSCVLIKAFRNDSLAKSDLKKIEGRTAYSVITQLELLTGANTKTKKETVIQIFESYYGIPVNAEISKKAVQVMQTYISGQQVLSVPDCLIAATALVTGFPLLTYNTKDFNFIRGLQLFNQKDNQKR
jgi:predicted nucleic acid-binding protein